MLCVLLHQNKFIILVFSLYVHFLYRGAATSMELQTAEVVIVLHVHYNINYKWFTVEKC